MNSPSKSTPTSEEEKTPQLHPPLFPRGKKLWGLLFESAKKHQVLTKLHRLSRGAHPGETATGYPLTPTLALVPILKKQQARR